MYIQDLIIEVTRKCNMSCEFCLRGEPQKKNITYKTMFNFFKNNNIKEVNCITFSGGEPTLNLKGMKDCLQICKDLNVSVYNFYVAINGTKVEEEFLYFLVSMYNYCAENEFSLVQVSTGYPYDYAQNEDEVKKLECFKFFSKKSPTNYSYYINEGRAIEFNRLNGVEGREIGEPEPLEIEDDQINEPYLYLNAKGDILTDCDYSYKSQNKFKIGNVNESTLYEMENNQRR